MHGPSVVHTLHWMRFFCSPQTLHRDTLIACGLPLADQERGSIAYRWTWAVIGEPNSSPILLIYLYVQAMMMASKYRIHQTLMQGLTSYVSVLLDMFVFVCV